ncbi:CynX/NimT family MFS transporter [Luteibacter aegosomatissinici]|uniref:MFS transporter n=1 Tax=Luteibacter aegosomatissinici TaxID=2911539 RepID=UPI001FFB91D9|nr:MFS transporter [Luteibacter aegosomatissinici]UPG94555.1 MFS transporter [Luteibacter aegosomatissinici]
MTLIGLVFRPAIVSMGPLLGDISEQFGLSHTGASLLTAIPDVLMGVLAVPAPALARRYGRDRVMLVALCLVLLATLGRAFSPSSTMLFLSTTLVGCGIAVAGALVGGFIKSTFPGRAPLLIGVYSAALALGATLAAGLSGPLAAYGGWRLGAGVWALPGVSAIIAWLLIERHQRHQATKTSQRYRLPLRQRKAWLIGLFYAADNFIYYALVSWIAPLYREHGLSDSTAGLILASFTGCFLVANPIAGALSRSSDRRQLLATFSAITLIGLVVLALAPDAAPFAVLPLISFGIGGGFTLGMVLPLDNTHDQDEANIWGAFMLLIAYIFASAGPLLVGALRDITGSFDIALWILVAVGVAMLVLTPLLGPQNGYEASTQR